MGRLHFGIWEDDISPDPDKNSGWRQNSSCLSFVDIELGATVGGRVLFFLSL